MSAGVAGPLVKLDAGDVAGGARLELDAQIQGEGSLTEGFVGVARSPQIVLLLVVVNDQLTGLIVLPKGSVAPAIVAVYWVANASGRWG